MKKKISNKYSKEDIETALALKTIILGVTDDKSLPAEVKIELVKQLNFKNFQKHEKTIDTNDIKANLTKSITILPTQQPAEEQGFFDWIIDSCKCIADNVLPAINYDAIRGIAQELITKTGIDPNKIAIIQFMIDKVITKVEEKYSDVEIIEHTPRIMTDKRSSPPPDQYQINILDETDKQTPRELLNSANLNIKMLGELSDDDDLVDLVHYDMV